MTRQNLGRGGWALASTRVGQDLAARVRWKGFPCGTTHPRSPSFCLPSAVPHDSAAQVAVATPVNPPPHSTALPPLRPVHHLRVHWKRPRRVADSAIGNAHTFHVRECLTVASRLALMARLETECFNANVDLGGDAASRRCNLTTRRSPPSSSGNFDAPNLPTAADRIRCRCWRRMLSCQPINRLIKPD